MKNAAPKATLLEDYKPLPFTLEEIDLTFDLDEEKTVVTAKSRFHSIKEGATLVLNGVDLKLVSLTLNGDEPEYSLSEHTLTIPRVPAQFVLEVVTEISPKANSALEGLYVSGDILCTQNEPEGFRHITYFLDRSDVMAKYTTTLIADKGRYPILLSNGNPIGSGDSGGGKHWVRWHDPFPKPSYLFALVAGDLGMIEDSFVTKSGRTIALRIYCDHGQESKCDHAMRSLKKSMKWDEEVFGLEYDLDIFMIVAVDSFNFGAMENKGLNIFNSSCALADEQMATDDNFIRVEGVIAHEYFHNWTGDRVTCRDWFQLTLKEGLTVFRDQEFTADMHSRPVKRIEDVEVLRSYQFPEDAGPTSHPIKPKSYLQINNFYTSTIYNKGAEVIRMIHTLIGHQAFCEGITTYFSLYDGQAVTTEDFLFAMEKASGYDLSLFSRWYHQSGTPELFASYSYDEKLKTLTLTIRQQNPPTADQKEKSPLICPIKTVLLSQESGKPLTVKLKGNGEAGEHCLIVDKQEVDFVFEGVEEPATLSLNRGFSAPVKMNVPYSDQELMFLMAHDTDPFNRWDAGQELSAKLILSGSPLGEEYFDAFGKILRDESIDEAFKALAITLPAESILGQRMEIIDFDAIHKYREEALSSLADTFFDSFVSLYHACQERGSFSLEPDAMGRRALKNRCLAYLVQSGRSEGIEIAVSQFRSATNMTDEMAAFSTLVNSRATERDDLIAVFYDKWKKEMLVMCKWLSVIGYCKLPGALEAVKALLHDPVYNLKVPNTVRALLGSFIQNHVQFHAINGEGYAFIADQIAVVDALNPYIAASLAGGFKKFARVDGSRQKMMRQEIEKLLALPKLSSNSYEILSKCIQEAGLCEKA